MKRKTNLLLMFLLSLLMFSCEKETTEPEVEVITSTDIVDHMPTVATVFKHLIFESLFNVFTTPALHGLQGVQGDTRDGCVESTLSPASGFPTTLTQTYSTPSGSCSGTVIRPDIIGELSILINAPILTANNGLDDILISITQPLTINGYKLEVLGSGNIQLNYTSGGGEPGYFYYLPTEGVRVTDCSGGPTNGYVTTLMGNDFGSGDQVGKVITDGGVIPDDPNNPLSYIDNMFSFTISEAPVTCQTSASGPVTNLCVDTSDDLEFQPVACGCITDGTLRVREADCSGNNTNSNAIQYRFSDPDTADPGCDAVARRRDARTTDIVTTYPATNTDISIQSCDPL